MKTKKDWSKRFSWLGIALCGLCCALPVLGTAVGMASLSALSIYLEKISILALGVAMFFFWYAWYSKRKKERQCTASCNTDCECKSETSV